MASRSLGSLTLDLIAKIGGFEQGMDKAARHADKRMREIERRSQAFGNAIGKSLRSAAGHLLAFAGVTASVSAGIGAIKDAIDRADNIRDLSIRLGLSTEALSKFGYAATQTGTDIEALNKGLLRLSKNAVAALDPKSKQSSLFEALGISKEQLRDLDTLVPAIAEKFQGMADGVQKAALAQELFGKSGAQLIEFLNQGADGLEKMGDRAAELGIVIDKDTAEAADRFNDTLADLKAAAGGLATQVASALMPQLEELLLWAVEFTSDGANAAQIAEDIASGARSIAEAIGAIRSVFGVLGDLRDLLGASDRAAQGLLGSLGANNAISTFLKEQIPGAYKPFIGGPKPQKSTLQVPDYLQLGQKPFSAVAPVYAPPLMGPEEIRQAREAARIAAALDKRNATGGRTASGASKGASKGKTEAEKEAERLETALRRMADAEREWQVELKDNGNPIAQEYANRLADITKQAEKFKEDGIPTKEVEAFVEKMKALASQINAKELAEFQQEFVEQTEAMAAALEGPGSAGFAAYRKEIKELEKELKNGLITQEQYASRVAVMLTPPQEVIAGLREEIELIGLSDIAQQKLIATKQAGADATEEEIDQIERLIEAREQANKAADLQREIETGLADAIFDVASGAKSAGDAVKDFFDDLAKYILRMIAENWAKQIAGLFTGSGGSSGGGESINWIATIANIFGGARASGGATKPNTLYRVNENGTEMLSIGGRDYLMMGSQAGNVTPNSQLTGGSGVVQNIQFNVAGRVSDETRSQAAAKIAYETRRATVRN